jgi:hypothetical protein
MIEIEQNILCLVLMSSITMVSEQKTIPFKFAAGWVAYPKLQKIFVVFYEVQDQILTPAPWNR